MAAKRLTLRYSVAAVLVALAIIGTSLYVSPPIVNAKTNFVVMLTDPPKMPEGTTEIEVTYSNIQVHVRYADGTSNWVAYTGEDAVDLLSLVNITETIADFSLPTDAYVDKLKLTLSDATATINGEEHDVVMLSEQLVINLKETKLEGARTGALIDLRPILHEIKAVDDEGNPVSYYVLVPSANAVVKKNVSEEHRRIGAKHGLTEEEIEELDEEYRNHSKNVTITDALLEVEDDTTTLMVWLKNVGTRNATVHGLTLFGNFTFSKVLGTNFPGMGGEHYEHEYDHLRAIPFRLDGNNLIPRFGEHDRDGGKCLELEPGETVKLTFSDVIEIRPNEHGKGFSMTLTPILGDDYTIRVSGEGSQTETVTAESG